MNNGIKKNKHNTISVGKLKKKLIFNEDLNRFNIECIYTIIQSITLRKRIAIINCLYKIVYHKITVVFDEKSSCFVVCVLIGV